MRRQVAVAIGIVFGACTDDLTHPQDELYGETSQQVCDPKNKGFELFKCYGCGANGLRRASYNNLFSQMDRNALAPYGLWDYGANGPVSVCAPNTGDGSSCKMRDGWVAWMNAGTWVRTDMMENLVKLGANSCFTVYGNNRSFTGMFDVAPAVSQSWGPVDQEYLSAAFLALLNTVEGVALCLNTDRDPNRCAGMSQNYGVAWEGVFFGNAIQGSRFMAISGGTAARYPGANLRFGTVSGVSATLYNHQSWRCAMSGSGETLAAGYCDSDVGRWHHPVTVLTPRDPVTWYYSESGTLQAKPSFWP